MAYLLLLVISAFLDAMGDDFPEGNRFYANLAIVIVVSVLSVTFNQTILFRRPAQTETVAERSSGTLREYRIAVPYADFTLRRHVGERIGERTLVFVTSVKASNRDGAVAAAKVQFWDQNNLLTAPFDTKRAKSPENIFVDSDRIIVETGN